MLHDVRNRLHPCQNCRGSWGNDRVGDESCFDQNLIWLIQAGKLVVPQEFVPCSSEASPLFCLTSLGSSFSVDVGALVVRSSR